jgi:hypothetical protein
MNNISKVSLENTLYLIQLAREAALAKGQTEQANRLTPVAEEMRKVVSVSRQAPASAPAPSGILGQSDFQKMLDASQSKAAPKVEATSNILSSSAVTERSRIVGAMSSSGMSDLDIARQMGMTRDEVKLVLNYQNRGKYTGEVSK